MKLSDQLKDLSHHAYCLAGGEAAKTELLSILEKKHKLVPRGNSDFFDKIYETFAIDDARAVKAQADIRPIHVSGKKIFVLTMTGITSEAQNALLKLLEEPPEYAHFFLIIPSAHLLLPTVKSRLSFLDAGQGDSAGNASVIKEVQAFLTSVPSKRLDFAKKFMEDVSKEKRSKQDVIDFLNTLQEVVYGKGVKSGPAGNTAAQVAALEAIETARRYMNDRAPSLKMLLEYVALSV